MTMPDHKWTVEVVTDFDTSAEVNLTELSKAINAWKATGESRDFNVADEGEEDDYESQEITVLTLQFAVHSAATIKDLRTLEDAVTARARIFMRGADDDILCYHEYELDLNPYVMSVGNSGVYPAIKFDVLEEQLFLDADNI